MSIRKALSSLTGCCTVIALVACNAVVPSPPPTKQVAVVDTIHGVDFKDSFRWLEDQDSPDTRQWLETQNAYADRIVDDTVLIAEVRARLEQLMDLESIGSPQRAGDFEYFTMRRRGEEHEMIYRRPAPSEEDDADEITSDGDYEVVLDPHLLDPGHRKQVHLKALSKDGLFMIYAIQDGGADELELYVRDLKTGEDLAERYPSALYDDIEPFFEDDGSEAFYYTCRSRKTGPRLYRHVIGTESSTDEIIWGEGYGPTHFIEAEVINEGKSILLITWQAWTSNEIWIMNRDTRALRAVVTEIDAHFTGITEWTGDPSLFPAGTLIVRTDHEAPNYKLVAIDPDQPGPENWRTVIPEQEDVFTEYKTIEGRYFATYLHNVSTKIRMFELDGAAAGELEIPEHFSATISDAPGDSTAFLALQSFTTPEVQFKLNLAEGERDVSEPAKVGFSTDQYTVKQVWYASKDGTQVPMHVVHRTDIELTGDHPTLLYGYGGFDLPILPRFSPFAAVWLERGGVYAIANIRGGGEFGERWHRDGMLEKKQNVFDDFNGAAEWLIDNDYTNPERLAIRGVSNGGLLVGAALTQRPELYRAVLCEFPDLDMVRFNQFTETNNMPALLEYGDAADPAQFEFLRLHSPYQNVRDGVDYPAVMLVTGDLDTRVPPLQARKMAARLQTATRSGLPIILRSDEKSGHASRRGRPMSMAIREDAIGLTFLIMQLRRDSGSFE